MLEDGVGAGTIGDANAVTVGIVKFAEPMADTGEPEALLEGERDIRGETEPEALLDAGWESEIDGVAVVESVDAGWRV